jgi:hypothetical protein
MERRRISTTRHLTANEGEGLWRRFPHMACGNLYPTHGLGPVAHYMDIIAATGSTMVSVKFV